MALPLDLAAVVSTTLEGIFYGASSFTLCSHDAELTHDPGFSVFMFGVTLYILQQNGRRLDRRVNYRMVAISWALLICSTAVCVPPAPSRADANEYEQRPLAYGHRHHTGV